MNDLFEYMDRYFKDELTPLEKEAFEKRCSSDAVFARELAVYITINDHLRRQWLEQRKEQLAALENENETLDDYFSESKESTATVLPVKEKGDDGLPEDIREGRDQYEPNDLSTEKHEQGNGRGRVKRLFRFAIAAAVTGVIALFLTRYLRKETNAVNVAVNTVKTDTAKTLRQPDTSSLPGLAKKEEHPKDTTETHPGKEPPQPTPDMVSAARRDALFAESFEADAAPDTVATSLKNALAHYRAKEYEATIAGLDKARENTERGGEQTSAEELQTFYVYYYKAQSYLALGKLTKALPNLNAAIDESPDEFLKSSAQWYLALAYLKQGNVSGAQKVLDGLAKNSSAGKYKALAEKLSRRIKPE